MPRYLRLLLESFLGVRSERDSRLLSEIFIATALLDFLLGISLVPITYFSEKFAVPLLSFVEGGGYLVEVALNDCLGIVLPALNIVQADNDAHLIISTCSPNSMPKGIILPRIEKHHQVELNVYSPSQQVRRNHDLALIYLIHQLYSGRLRKRAVN